MYIEKGEMRADEYIKKTREYLNYLEEHIENVRKAFCELTQKCDGMAWVGDDYTWLSLRTAVSYHDVSKLSEYEFVQYRKAFYPVNNFRHNENDYNIHEAWEHHKTENSHHHESVKTDSDIVHMVIDWTAMGYRFGGTAQQYYEENKDKIKLSENHEKFMYELFDRLKKNG